MKKFMEVLTNSNNKIGAVYKCDINDMDFMALYKGLVFGCGNVGVEVNGNIITLKDNESPKNTQVNFNIENVTNLRIGRKDKSGMQQVDFSIKEERFCLMLAA